MNWRMNLYNINKIAALICVLLSLVACDTKLSNNSRVAALPYYEDATFSPQWLSSTAADLSNFHRIPDFEFLDQEGDTISQATINDKIYVADFFFTTCPGICPKMTNNMKLIQEAFQADDSVLLLSHSVTPEIDSVATLKKYAEAKGVDASKWHLVTGARKDIYTLGRSFYFVEEDLGLRKGEDEFLHTENFVLIDKDKHIRGIYNGLNKTAVNQLIADIKTLQKEG